MRDYIKKALTKTVAVKGSKGKTQCVEVPPSDRLIYAVYFSITMVACLTALQIVHLTVLGTWNTEVFAAISGLIGTITGIFLTQKM